MYRKACRRQGEKVSLKPLRVGLFTARLFFAIYAILFRSPLTAPTLPDVLSASKDKNGTRSCLFVLHCEEKLRESYLLLDLIPTLMYRYPLYYHPPPSGGVLHYRIQYSCK